MPIIINSVQLGYSKYLRKCNWEIFGFYQIKYLGILKNTFEYHTKSETMLDVTIYSASNDLS